VGERKGEIGVTEKEVGKVVRIKVLDNPFEIPPHSLRAIGTGG